MYPVADLIASAEEALPLVDKVTPRYHMRDTLLPFSPPSITEDEIDEVVEALRSGWITTGPRTEQFEANFAPFVKAEAALALNSCTAGLHLALATLGVGPGDEVISTPMTFAASVNVIEHVGATPVLVDIDPETLNIDPEQVVAAITDRTRAILPVHYAGHPVEMQPLLALAEEHGIFIIEDAAHAVDAEYEGQRVGSIGDLTAFSFYATKNLTTAEGGMLTGRAEWIDEARILSLHGMNHDAWRRYEGAGKWYYEVVAPGFKYNMTDIQAALGLVQMRRLPDMQAKRREIVARYHAALDGVAALQIPVERENVKHAWHLYVLRLNLSALSIDRAAFIDELAARNIATSVHFIPIHLHPYYRDKYGFELPVATAEYQRLVSLPLHPGLTDDDVDDVIAAVLDVVERNKR